MTLYIAGPMTGIAEFNYPAFVTAEAELRSAGHDVLNPVRAEDDNPTPGNPQPWDWYMRKAIRMLTHADGVALLDGWQRSRGATLEHNLALSLQLDVRPLAGWLS